MIKQKRWFLAWALNNEHECWLSNLNIQKGQLVTSSLSAEFCSNKRLVSRTEERTDNKDWAWELATSSLSADVCSYYRNGLWELKSKLTTRIEHKRVGDLLSECRCLLCPGQLRLQLLHPRLCLVPPNLQQSVTLCKFSLDSQLLGPLSNSKYILHCSLQNK